MVTIKTHKGDDGKSRFLCRIVDKDSPLLEAIGSIDELQAILEMVGGEERVVDDLGKIMGELGTGKEFEIFNLKFLINETEENNFNLDKFVKFKGKKACELNWARTVCRRVERRVVTLNKIQKIDQNILKYFNRLSGYLFVKAIESDK